MTFTLRCPGYVCGIAKFLSHGYQMNQMGYREKMTDVQKKERNKNGQIKGLISNTWLILLNTVLVIIKLCTISESKVK